MNSSDKPTGNAGAATLQATTAMLPLTPPPLPEPISLEDIAALSEEIRDLAAQKNAVILAHNYQVAEVQDVADYTGDSLGLSIQAANAKADRIVFCGVHFMAETAKILSPDKQVLIPDTRAGCSLAASIDADQLRAWKDENPGATVVMYVNTTAEVKALTDYCCTSSNAAAVVNAIPDDQEILFGPDMFLGSYVEKVTKRRMKVWLGECHVHAGIRPAELNEMLEKYPDADLMIHPECGCSTQAMEYLACGDIDPERTFILSTSGMVEHVKQSDAKQFVVATETGIFHPLKLAAPDREFIPANVGAVCGFMKAITLTNLRDALRDEQYEVNVDPAIAELARVPIERMIAITA
ncbi:MAG: quinolinate synthase NadA [Thermoleophilaceae bacterium]|nr:quinolinate synthase NadA [Thermoleophilaceae bacterium]